MADSQWMIDSDGSLVQYADPFKSVDEAKAQRAQQAELDIRITKARIEGNFLGLAIRLDEFDRERLYLGRGYETMRDWAESPEIELSWRVVQDLIRIRRVVMPMIEAQVGGEDEAIQVLAQAGISKIRAALPLLRDDQTKDRFFEVVEQAHHMPYKAVVAEVKALRGHEPSINDRNPVVFMARVQRGDAYHRVTVTCSDGVDIYEAGKLAIKPSHWGRWEARFGDFVQFVDEVG